MTWANRITLLRLFLIPFFIGALLYYQQTVHHGAPEEHYRVTAIVIFIVAAVCDGIDGYVARHFNQKSRLGSILDPLADKLLMFSALVTLSLISGPGIPEFPLWFPIIVIGRDSLLLIGTSLLHYLNQQVHIQPHWTGKASTFFVLVAISAALLKFDWTLYACYAGALFALISTVIYIRAGLHQFHPHGNAGPAKE